MICKECRGQKCLACQGDGVVGTFEAVNAVQMMPVAEPCSECGGTGRVAVDHAACVERNVDKMDDCDCQHRE